MGSRQIDAASGESRLMAGVSRTADGDLRVADGLGAEVLRLQLEVEHLRAMASAAMAELSNHWTAVVGTLELAGWGAPDGLGGPAQHALKSAVFASANLLRTGTRAFVRYQRTPTRISLARLLETISELLGSRLPRGARLAYQFDEGLPTFEADELLLAQLVDEMVSNAAEQIESEETIRIRTGQLSGCPPYEPGHYLRCYRFVGPALAVSVSWRPPAPLEDHVPATLLETDYFGLERLLAIHGALHLDLSLAVHLDESETGIRTASLLIPLDPTSARRT